MKHSDPLVKEYRDRLLQQLNTPMFFLPPGSSYRKVSRRRRLARRLVTYRLRIVNAGRMLLGTYDCGHW